MTFASLVLMGVLLSTVQAQTSPGAPQAAVSSVAKYGKIQGKVVDSSNGQPLIGTTIRVLETQLGAVSDLDGNFTVRNVPEGKYTVVATSIGYSTYKVTDVEVSASNPAVINLSLSAQTTQLNNVEITVKAERVKTGDVFLLKERQQSNSVSDAISAETISRSGAGNAAQAMLRVTGASVVDGKYAVIRGLGERYSNTRLNGSALPSADPDKQAFQIDLVPSDLLENIVVTKSYSVDQPGNFTGGSVNLVTKDFPEHRTFSVSTGGTSNTVVTGESVLSGPTSSTDWRGHDDGLRGIPQFVLDNFDRIPKNNVIYRKKKTTGSNQYPGDEAKALFLDSITNAFHPQFNSLNRTGRLNQNYTFSYGDNIPVFGRSLGIIGNLTYNRSQSGYRNGEENLYAPLTSTSLDAVDLLKDDRGADNVLWGGLGSVHYSVTPFLKVGARYVYNRNGNSEARFLRGFLNDFDPGQVYESHDNKYTERTLNSFQGNADVFFKLGIPVRADFQISDSKTIQSEILDQVVYAIGIDSSQFPTLDTTTLAANSSNLPAVYYRDINETNRQYDLNLKLELGKKSSFKFGGSYLDKQRTFRQTVFKYQIDDLLLMKKVHGDMNAFSDSARLVDSSGLFYSYNAYLYVFPTKSDEYDGMQQIPAWYGMLETPVPFIENLKVVGGVRHERTDMSAADLTPTHSGGKINSTDWLPSVSLTYSATPSMNFRAVFSKTVARPNIREIAGFRNLDFAASKYFYGNPNLKYTKITNYDLRWEWFTRPSEIIAISAFYKDFVDPIEVAYTAGGNYDRQPVNASEARNYGVEFEVRKSLDQLSEKLSNFSVSGNFTLVNSKVKIPDNELREMRSLDPNVIDTRPMANQSPYIVNLSLLYDSKKSGTSATLLYNAFGRRFYYNAQGGAPDIYEMPRHLVDLIVSQNIFDLVTLKFQARNILNQHFEADYYYTGSGNKVTFERYDIGRTYGLSVNAKLW